MVRVVLAGAVSVAVATALGGVASLAGAPPSRLPSAVFSDQEGRRLDLESLRGRVLVVVYGGRDGVPQHISWGRRLDTDLRARGAYHEQDDPETRPVRILAVAQMGRIPRPFREMLRAFIRPHVEAGHSLWLDWDSVLAAAFGERSADSTVIVVDTAGTVRLVVGGRPEGEPYRAVSETLRQLH